MCDCKNAKGDNVNTEVLQEAEPAVTGFYTIFKCALLNQKLMFLYITFLDFR